MSRGIDRWEEMLQLNIGVKRIDDRNIKIKMYIWGLPWWRSG